MQQQMKSSWVSVVAKPNIFTSQQIKAMVPPGLSIADIVCDMSPAPGYESYAKVYLGRDYIPQEKWGSVHPKGGASVAIVFVPHGGGKKKNPLATIMSIALTVAAPYAGAAIAGASGGWAGNLFLGTSFIGRIAGGAVSIIGGLIVNALAPPPKPRGPNVTGGPAEGATQFITGAQNQANLYSAVPVVLGKKRMVPPYGMRPFTEQVGDDQYVRMLFVWGYGPLEISDIRIGDTSIDEFDDVEIETKQGFSDDTALTLITNDPRENQLSISLASGVYNTQTTSANTDEISIDITFPRGLVEFGTTGNKISRTVAVDYEYSVHGAGVWTAATKTVTRAQSAAFRENIRIPVSRNTYDVRLKRTTADASSDTVYDVVDWTALRSVKNESPVNMPGVAMTAIRIRATGQLNGVISQLNGVVESIVPDFDGADWDDTADQSTWHTTSNPASLFRYVLQCSANAHGLADSRIDIDAVEEWHGNCETAGYEYNAVVDSQRSLQDVLSSIAAAGRAKPGRPDGKWLVVEDKVKTVPVQHFTPRNSWGFSGDKTFIDQPHAWRVKFINRDKEWMQDERVVYDDGYSEDGSVPGTVAATRFAPLDLTDGITSADLAWKFGRYHIASLRLRPESYSFNADFENIVCTRGDLIRFNHDVCLFGLSSSRVKDVLFDGNSPPNVTGIVVDDACLMEGDKTYNVRIRLADGGSLLEDIDTEAGYQTTLNFSAPFSYAAHPVDISDLVMFGESGEESVELIVKDIQRENDLVAKITCVDYAPELLTADTGTIPAHDSQISTPVDLRRPSAPVIVSVQAGDEAIVVNADGSFSPSILVTLAPPDFPLPLEAVVRIRRSDEVGFSPAAFTQSSGKIDISGVEAGKLYDVQVVYKNPVGMFSAATTYTNVEVTGGTTPPDDVEDFTINTLGGNAFLSWDAPTNLNVSYYRLKFNNAVTGATWANSVDLIENISRLATSATVPAQSGTYLIKAIGISGLESDNETIIVSNIASLAGFNAVEAVVENPTFAGAKIDVDVVSGSLELDGGALIGLYEFDNAVDLGGVYTSRLSANIEATGRDTTATVDDWTNVDDVENWDGGVDPSSWGLQLQLRWTEDDPSGSPAWSEWQNFVIGDYTARAFEFRAYLTSTLSTITPSISTLEVDVDMPDQSQSNNDLTSDSTDSPCTEVLYPSPFKARPGLGLAVQNMATGDYYVLTGPAGSGDPDETGFGIIFKNAAGTRITRTFDYVAKGYGLLQ